MHENTRRINTITAHVYTECLPYPQTTDSAKTWFRDNGLSFSKWCGSHGFNKHAARDVLNGRVKGEKGNAHAIAVALGLKPNPISNSNLFRGIELAKSVITDLDALGVSVIAPNRVEPFPIIAVEEGPALKRLDGIGIQGGAALYKGCMVVWQNRSQDDESVPHYLLSSCRYCGKPTWARTSRAASNTSREIHIECKDADCGAGHVVLVSFVRETKPSKRTGLKPALELPKRHRRGN